MSSLEPNYHQLVRPPPSTTKCVVNKSHFNKFHYILVTKPDLIFDLGRFKDIQTAPARLQFEDETPDVETQHNDEPAGKKVNIGIFFRKVNTNTPIPQPLFYIAFRSFAYINFLICLTTWYLYNADNYEVKLIELSSRWGISI